MSFLAYKGFDKDLKCRGFQYEIGKTYSMEDKPEVCSRGFHCCKRLSDVFSYYSPWTFIPDPYCSGPFSTMLPNGATIESDNRFCVVEVLGNISMENDFSTNSVKYATNKIKILWELTREDMIELVECDAKRTETDFIQLRSLVNALKKD